MKIYTFAFLLISYTLLAVIPPPLLASPKLNSQPIVDEIVIKGLWRTKPNVVLRELLFRENEVLTTTALYKSIQRLKNLQIFSKVIPLLELKPKNRIKLIFELQEKWTIIPYASLSGGGGTTYAYAGIYDINTFGTFIETGIQYDNWNGHHGGLAWLRNPRFLNQRLLFGFDLMKTKRVRQLYSHDAKSQGSYVLNTNKILFILKKEITPYFQLGGKLALNKTQLINYETTSNINAETQLQLNDKPQSNIFNTLFIELGKLNYDNYLVAGKLSSLSLRQSHTWLKPNTSITQIDWLNRAFWQLPYHANIGFRFKMGWTNTNDIQNLYYIGGFQNVRGYLDGQFRNKVFWQMNAEYRIPSYRSNWLVLQHVFFIDTTSVGDALNDVIKSRQQFSSAGFGIRIISPRIHSFNGRIDITPFTSGNSPSHLSFGAQQFF